MIEGWVEPSDDMAVAHQEIDVRLRLEYAGEFMTQEELDAFLATPEAIARVVKLLPKLVARAFDETRSRTVGWDASGNMPIELVGVTRCEPLGFTFRTDETHKLSESKPEDR